jgi:hypothetical protein
MRSRRGSSSRSSTNNACPCLRNIPMFLKHGTQNRNNFNVVVPTGFEPVFEP